MGARKELRRAMRKRLRRLRKEEARLRGAADPEAVHDLRVATRRLAAVLELGKGRIRGLKRLRGALGAVRDWDIRRELLEGLRPELPPEAQGALGRLLEEAGRARRGAEGPVREAADRAGRRPRGLGAFPRTRSLEAQLWRRLARLEEELGRLARAPEDPPRLHEARKSAKRLRYALELAEGSLPGLAREAERLQALQEALGRHHDAWDLGRWVRARREAVGEGAAAVLEGLRARRQAAFEDFRRLAGHPGLPP